MEQRHRLFEAFKKRIQFSESVLPETLPPIEVHDAPPPQDLDVQRDENYPADLSACRVERKKDTTRQDPLPFCKLITAYPRACFGVFLAMHVLVLVTTAILAATGYNIIPADFQVLPLEIMDSDVFLRDLAWEYRQDDPAIIQHNLSHIFKPDWPRHQVRDVLSIYYEVKRGTVFTKGNLKIMKTIEDDVFGMAEYQTKFCLLAADRNCTKPRSILRYFDGTHSKLDPVFDDPKFDNITAVLHKAATLEETKSELEFFLSKDASISARIAYSSLCRTALMMGGPLENNATEEEDTESIRDYAAYTLKPRMEKLVQDNLVPNLDISFLSPYMFFYDLLGQAFIEMAFAIGSILFIFLFAWFQTGSLWIAGWGVFSIVCCFFTTNFVYRVVIDFTYFGFFHIIAIFIILGIGADDIFIFYNTWNATAHNKYPSLSHRLSDCYRKAAVAMLVTSLTTMVAFLATAVSPLLAMSSFGIFSGILVGVNYINVIVFFPTVVVTYHLNYESKVWPCCRPCEEKCQDSKGNHDNIRDDLVVEKRAKVHPVVRFFRNHYFPFVTHKTFRWVVILGFMGAVGFFVFSSTNLKVDSEQFQMYKPHLNYGKAWSMPARFRPNMLEESEFLDITIVWGLKKRDLSACHASDVKCIGTNVWDDAFDLNLPPAQIALKEFCHKLRYGLTPQERHALRLQQDPVTGEPQVACFIQELQSYLLNAQDVLEMREPNLTVPLTESKMTSFMRHQPEVYNDKPLTPTFYRYFEIGVSHWLNNFHTGLVTQELLQYSQLVGEARDPDNSRRARNGSVLEGGSYGSRLRYAAIKVNTSIPANDLGFADGIPHMNVWENFVNAEIAKMPAQLQNGFQIGSGWHWVLVQKSLVDNAVLGMVIGVSLALVIITAATQNYILGSLATFIICCITISVIGVIPLAGWKLGVTVSMNLSLVVGLAVDYVVHLAEGYHMSQKKDRLGRVHDMLGHVGISVFSGAITTLGAAIFMFFGKILFFFQFGTILFCTIGFSLVFALGLFTAFLGVIGPENDQGSIIPMFFALKNLLVGRKADDLGCDKCEGRGFISPDKESVSEGGVNCGSINGSRPGSVRSRNGRTEAPCSGVINHAFEPEIFIHSEASPQTGNSPKDSPKAQGHANRNDATQDGSTISTQPPDGASSSPKDSPHTGEHVGQHLVPLDVRSLTGSSLPQTMQPNNIPAVTHF